MKSRKAVTITLTQAAIDALTVSSSIDHRTKSQQIEFLILEDVAKKGTQVPGYASSTTAPKIIDSEANKATVVPAYLTTNGTAV